jgi:hypothetical protein
MRHQIPHPHHRHRRSNRRQSPQHLRITPPPGAGCKLLLVVAATAAACRNRVVSEPGNAHRQGEPKGDSPSLSQVRLQQPASRSDVLGPDSANPGKAA